MPKTKSARKVHSNSSPVSYGCLEPRMMLSADLDAARNVVADGDFETDGTTAFFAFANGDESNTQAINIISLTTDHSNVVELDSVAGQMNSIAQDVITEADEEYIVSFDLRGRPVETGDIADTNEVELLFDGVGVGVFSGIEKWQTINVSVTATSDLTRLEFRETSTSSDGKGILLDHISVAGVRESIVINGSVEDVNSSVASGVVNADDLPGFFAVNETSTPQIGVQATAGATNGSNVFNLNTSDVHLDRVFQNIHTEAGANYFVTFDLRNGDASNSDPANVRLRWKDEFAGSFFGTADWQRFGILLGADDGFSTLMFREAGGNSGSGIDAQIDNIKIYRVDSLTTDFVVDLNGNDAGTNVATDYVENSETNITANDLSLAFTNGEFLSSATARVLGYSGTEELIANTTGTGITSEFDSNTGILRLVGRRRLANYQQILRTLSFADSNDDPGEIQRRVLVSVTNGTAISSRSEVSLDVIPVNDAPNETPIPDVPLPQNNPLTINVGAIDPDDPTLSFALSVSGDTEIFGDTLPTISDIGQIQLTTVTHGSAEIVVSVNDPDGLGSEFTFTVDVPFTAPTEAIPNDFVQFSGRRQLSNTLPSLRNGVYDAAPTMTIDTSLNYQAVIETADGEIRFELFAAESPITVNNFVNLAEDGFFDGLDFHRVLDDFVAQ